MKLVHFLADEARRWGWASGREIVEIAGGFQNWAPDLVASGFAELPAVTGQRFAIDDIRFLPPVERGSKVMVAGANYRAHLKEFDLAKDTTPVAFMKPLGALIGAYDDIRYSPLTAQLDFEVELVVVIGTALAPGSDPMRSILGYTVGNDISQRDLQRGTPGIGMDFLGGKGLDGTTPVGPYIVTRDEFGETPPDLALTLSVNGEQRQAGRSSDMTWDVGRLAAFIDSRTALEPGDIIFTGTPPGVGQGDGRFLNDGDLVETKIECIGSMRNIVRRPQENTRS